ncbi:hypothetical protein MMC28_007178 [Mycoblastus sanguinarius]|nr:hypothetical protein [Mycoblastus sanguinarius]
MSQPPYPQARSGQLPAPIAQMLPLQQQTSLAIQQQAPPTIQRPIRQTSTAKYSAPPWPTTGIPSTSPEIEAFADKEKVLRERHRVAELARRQKEWEAWERMQGLLPAIKSQRSFKEQADTACDLFEELEAGNWRLQERIAELYIRAQKARIGISRARVGEGEGVGREGSFMKKMGTIGGIILFTSNGH